MEIIKNIPFGRNKALSSQSGLVWVFIIHIPVIFYGYNNHLKASMIKSLWVCGTKLRLFSNIPAANATIITDIIWPISKSSFRLRVFSRVKWNMIQKSRRVLSIQMFLNFKVLAEIQKCFCFEWIKFLNFSVGFQTELLSIIAN